MACPIGSSANTTAPLFQHSDLDRNAWFPTPRKYNTLKRFHHVSVCSELVVSAADPSSNLDDRVQPVADILQHGRTYPSPWMGLRVACAPIEGFGLVGEDIASSLRIATVLDGEGIRTALACHRATDNEAGLVECARGKDQKGMRSTHFASRLRRAIDPDHLAAIWDPGSLGLSPRAR
jgi:hypothetical protein